VIGWDLGGAHVKAARLDPSGAVECVRQVPCPLWQGMPHLHAAVQQLGAELGEAALHAVTMTGEMADLFPNRGDGVAQLVDAMRRLLPDATLRFWAGADGFVDLRHAGASAASIASANWRASAAVVAAHLPAALFLDIGSTTIDLVPVQGGEVRARGRDDAERLRAGELLYTGAGRTPIMALVEQVPFAGEWAPVLAEHFATTADVYRLLETLPEALDQQPAADGGDKTVEASARRLARTIGRDVESAPPEAWRWLAAWIARAQTRRIEDACDRVLSRGTLAADAPVVVAGAGRFLAANVASLRDRPMIEFGRLLPVAESERARATDCAPAVAVAWLARSTRMNRTNDCPHPTSSEESPP
jgi:probable H4MPT-linked C1 transfer pathway protein